MNDKVIVDKVRKLLLDGVNKDEVLRGKIDYAIIDTCKMILGIPSIATDEEIKILFKLLDDCNV